MFLKSSAFIRFVFQKQLWKIRTNEKKVYFTFDDGPIPEITEWVLDLLKLHQIKATFFCIGDNIIKHPHIFKKIIEEGHTVGNHTFHHLNGWRFTSSEYGFSVDSCQSVIEKYFVGNSKLFRPPYGKITPYQVNHLLKKGYKIVMWDIVSKDYDVQFGADKSLHMVLNHVSKGSIIVFHDSIKAFTTLQQILPQCIVSLKERGYTFDVLS